MSRDLLHFIAKSPSVFHAVRGVKAALAYAGFTELREEDTSPQLTAIPLRSRSRKILKSRTALMSV